MSDHRVLNQAQYDHDQKVEFIQSILFDIKILNSQIRQINEYRKKLKAKKQSLNERGITDDQINAMIKEKGGLALPKIEKLVEDLKL